MVDLLLDKVLVHYGKDLHGVEVDRDQETGQALETDRVQEEDQALETDRGQEADRAQEVGLDQEIVDHKKLICQLLNIIYSE